MHQRDSELCGISLHVLAVECEVLIHSDETLVAKDSRTAGSGLCCLCLCTVLGAIVTIMCNSGTLVTEWTEAKRPVVDVILILYSMLAVRLPAFWHQLESQPLPVSACCSMLPP